MPTKALILDANILIRAVLGRRVWSLLSQFAAEIQFLAPETAYAEAARHLPSLLQKRGADYCLAQAFLAQLQTAVSNISTTSYLCLQDRALQRIAVRDPNDWPVLACAMLLNAPIWTEDRDFFGCGIATWTSDRVEQYFST